MPCDDSPQEGVIRVPADMLSPEALDGIMEDFITREGTDYGLYEYSLDDKKAQVLAQIRSGQVIILFDPFAESCHLVVKDELPPGF